jgi:hypothetical protein
MAAKLTKVVESDGVTHHGWMFQCPGCALLPYNTALHCPTKSWGFNGDVEKPTFTPSILVRWDTDEKKHVCHSYVTDGRIQFLGDSTHPLAGQTVELPDWSEEF